MLLYICIGIVIIPSLYVLFLMKEDVEKEESTEKQREADRVTFAPLREKLFKILNHEIDDWEVTFSFHSDPLYSVKICNGKKRVKIDLSTFNDDFNEFEVSITSDDRTHTVYDKELSDKIAYFVTHLSSKEIADLAKKI